MDDMGSTRAQAAAENVIHSEDVPDGDDAASPEGGSMVAMPGAGGLGDAAGAGETRGDMSGTVGGKTGSFTGGTGIAGMDTNSTDTGRSDILGGGTAGGLGATQ